MGQMYSHLIASTGWTEQQVDRTHWFTVLDLLEYQKDAPPAHLLLRVPGEGGGNRAPAKITEMSARDESQALDLLRSVTGG